MAKKTGGLGRGLDSILGELPKEAGGNVAQASVTVAISPIKIDLIEANPYQPRKEFDETALDELAQSIRQQGVIAPITVRRMPDGKYQLIAGERRFRASQLAGLTEIPAYIRVATDVQMMEMALVENIQRENLNALEIAFSYKALIEECQFTHEQLAERVGKDRSVITNYLGLLNLPSEVQSALSEGAITYSHARALSSIDKVEDQIALLHDIVSRHLSAHNTEQLVKNYKDEKKPKSPVKGGAKSDLPATHANGQQMLRQSLQSEVDIKRSRRGKGTLTIHFNNDADFERILNLLSK